MAKYVKFLFLIFVVLVITACGNEDEQVTENETEPQEVEEVEEVEEVVEQEPAEPEFEHVYPFTGEPTNEDIDHRVVSVMINNAPAARPQIGLTKADVVFEILAEGNITRLLALFHSEQPDMIGPVRSARPYYFNLADDYGALYVHHGAAKFIEDMLKNGAADYLNGMYYDNDMHLFKRGDLRKPPHNSYVLFDGIYEVATDKGYDITADHRPMTFSTEEEVSIQGDAATEVSFDYGSSNNVRYVYDGESEKYLRFNGQEQSADLETEEPVQLDNVLILETAHAVVDDQGRREIDLQSGGKAYLLQKGKVQQVDWANDEGHLVPVKDGEVVPFVQGKTWINVIPNSPGLAEVTIQ
ncbi:DUF3048 domain-containing protein [Aquibacillus koreensis]|uniref:DUF3048 domain-containing protein n=1 Tax=Aquibacillus koreensis TaxID=279446 RepID=UPI002883290C|nr:DUF3048 domain-containing protein [Aquibacillus koreensis]